MLAGMAIHRLLPRFTPSLTQKGVA
jgi:hypothetical protein